MCFVFRLGGGDKDFVVCGRMVRPNKSGSMTVLRTFAFGQFVNNAPQPNKGLENGEVATTVMREPIENSM